MTGWRTKLALLLGTLALVWASAAFAQTDPRDRPSSVDNFEPITAEIVENPDAADWIMWRRTQNSWGYSPLDEINTENVGDLRLVWSWAQDPGTNQPTPLVYNGVMYISNPVDGVLAIDAASGDLIWQYQRELPEGLGSGLGTSGATRNLAMYEDKIFLATTDVYIVALDARTGQVVWETQKADYEKGYNHTSGPIIADGKVISGTTGCSRFYEDSCFITAHDPESGEEIWRTFTIPRDGEEGDDTWGDVPFEFRGGADSWIPGSYDPELDLIFWGVAQAKPWVRASRGTGDGETLYTNSTLALDPETGEIQWYYQYVPGETLDFDETYDQVLVDIDDRKTLFQIGKHGILWNIDRETGEFIRHRELVFQNVFDNIDPETGEVTYREDIIQAQVGEPIEVCPSTAGGHDWHGTSYNPELEILYIPLSQTCMTITGREVELVEGSGGSAASRQFHEMPGTDGNLGKFVAIDVNTLDTVWETEQRASFLTSPFTTAGGLVFEGDLDRYFRARDAASGEVLWQTRLPTSVQGTPTTFAVDGKQYVAVTTGLGGGSPRNVPSIVSPEIAHPMTGNGIFVFALPDSE